MNRCWFDTEIDRAVDLNCNLPVLKITHAAGEKMPKVIILKI